MLLAFFINGYYIVCFRSTGKALLGILSDMDLILSTDEHFLLGAWLKSANLTAVSESEIPLFMFNSINQITLWGPSGQVHDLRLDTYFCMFKVTIVTKHGYNPYLAYLRYNLDMLSCVVDKNVGYDF